MVADMSSGATYYWREVLLQAQTYYERWLNLSPLERSQLQVSRSPELCEPRFVRAEQRLVGMILKAFPESLKQECIAGGLMSSVQLIWRALVRYPAVAGISDWASEGRFRVRFRFCDDTPRGAFAHRP